MTKEDDNGESSNAEPDSPIVEPGDKAEGQEELPLLDLGDTSEEPETKKKFPIGKVLFLLILTGTGFLAYPYIQALQNSQSARQELSPVPSRLQSQLDIAEQEPGIESSAEVEFPAAIEEEPAGSLKTAGSPEAAPSLETGQEPETEVVAKPTELHLSGAPSSLVPTEETKTTETEEAIEAGESSQTLSFELQAPPQQEKITEETAEETVEEMIETEKAVEEESQTKRNKGVQAYLDFIESSAQQLADWIKEGYGKARDYLTSLFG